MLPIRERWTANSRTHKHRGRFVLDASVGQINYLDGQEYHEIDTTPVVNEDTEHTWEINKTPYRCRVSRRGRRRIWTDRNSPGKYITIGVPTFLDSDGVVQGRGWSWRKGDVEVKMDFGNTRVSFDIVLHSDQGISEVTFPFVRNNISKVAARKLLRLVLYDSSEVPIERPIQAVIRDNEVTLSWDATGMVYPVTVDPTIDVSVGTGADDGYWSSGFPLFSSTAIQIIHGVISGSSFGGWYRFAGVTIPQGATIDIGNMNLDPAAAGSSATSLIFYCVDEDDAAAPTSGAEYDADPKTTGTAWPSVPNWSQGINITTADFSPEVEQVVARSAWAGDHLLVQLENTGPSGRRDAAAFDHTTLDAPALHVEYTEAVSGPDAPLNPSAVAGIEKNTISWDDVVGAVSYNIYWALTTGVTQETGTKITGVTSPHEHTGLTPGQEYFYVVTAVNGDGESVDSLEVSATPLVEPHGFLSGDLQTSLVSSGGLTVKKPLEGEVATNLPIEGELTINGVE